MSNVAGSIRKLVLSGVTYDVLNDADFEEIVGRYENEVIPTSGKSIIKKTARAQNVSGVILAANGAEREVLRELSESIEPFTISYTAVSGDTFRNEGTINIENRTTMENKMTITLMPVNPKWEAFLAG